MVVAGSLAVASGALAADTPPQPVIVKSIGPKAMRVRIAAFKSNFVYPCSSPDNIQIFEGPVEPGASVRVETAAGCVCVAHTFDDSPDLNWSMGQSECRPQLCLGRGRAKRCWPNPDPTIRVTLSSRPPGK